MRIDSHQHFWKYNQVDYVWMNEQHAIIQKDFLPEHLNPLLNKLDFDGTISVQARQSLEETDFLLQLAEDNSFIKGVVGWVPFCDKKVEKHIEKYRFENKIVGFRHVIHDEPDNNFILRPDFNEGIKSLSKFGLCYDILIFGRHLPQTIEFVDSHPRQIFIIDHIAKPKINKNSFDVDWANHMKKISEREHVYCKLSGMVTEILQESWDIDLLKPYFETILDAFGPQRMIFGSDWPVCLLKSTYSNWVNAVLCLINRLSANEQRSIMGENAERIYLQTH
jgi:L-fuconolactonase